MLFPQYFHNTFTTILSDKLLLVVIDEQKNNLSNKFKLKPITDYHIGFVVKILRKCYECNTS